MRRWIGMAEAGEVDRDARRRDTFGQPGPPLRGVQQPMQDHDRLGAVAPAPQRQLTSVSQPQRLHRSDPPTALRARRSASARCGARDRSRGAGRHPQVVFGRRGPNQRGSPCEVTALYRSDLRASAESHSVIAAAEPDCCVALPEATSSQNGQEVECRTATSRIIPTGDPPVQVLRSSLLRHASSVVAETTAFVVPEAIAA
jgi:hypothetical protein